MPKDADQKSDGIEGERLGLLILRFVTTLPTPELLAWVRLAKVSYLIAGCYWELVGFALSLRVRLTVHFQCGF